MLTYLRFFRRELPLLSFGLSFTFFSSFGQTFLLSLFVPALVLEFGIGNAEFGGLYAAATLGSALLLPWTGSGLDRMRLPKFSLVVVALMAGSAFLLAASGTLLMVGVALLGIRLAGQGLSGHTALTAMARYYAAGRGKALSISSLGFPLGEALLPLLVAGAIAILGWRATWVGIGVAAILVFAPILLYSLSRSGVEMDPTKAATKDTGGEGEPEAETTSAELGRPGAPQTGGEAGPPGTSPTPVRSAGAEARPAPATPRSWTRREVLGDPRFWFVIPAALLAPFWVTGLFLYQTAIAGLKGWSIALMASAFLAFALSRVVLSLGAGGLIDRFSARHVFPLTPLPLAVGFAVLMAFDGGWAAYLFMACLGVSVGASGTVKPALWAELYGVRNLGAIQSMMAALMVVSTAASPLLVGVILDRGVPLERLLWGGMVTVGIGALLALRVHPRWAAQARSPVGGRVG